MQPGKQTLEGRSPPGPSISPSVKWRRCVGCESFLKSDLGGTTGTAPRLYKVAAVGQALLEVLYIY